MRGRRRGFLLVLALFLVTVFAILALAFLGSGNSAVTAALKAQQVQQALVFAESGVEDALLKLERDQNFPPPLGDEGKLYGYSEPILDVESSSPVGSYDVVVDTTYMEKPYYMVRIRATGRLQTSTGEVFRTVRADVDICPFNRQTGMITDANPNLYKIVNWTEEGLDE